jgi:hypothetical protein
MTLRAGEGIVINYDGAGGEIAVSTPQWFVAEITGTVTGSSPVIHKWKKKVPKKDGKTYEDANPSVIGDGTANPAYLPALTTGTTATATATGLVYMRLRSTNDTGQCVYEIIGSAGAAAAGSGSSGSATIEVVTDVICTPTGIEVSTVTLSGADYDNAVIRQFLALSDVTPSSYLGNQGRVVKVNDTATALEFGAIGEGPTYTTFIALSDSPATYGTSSTYYSLTVGSNNASVVFSANNVTTTNSLTGGGNPNSPAWSALKLVNDTATPGNSKYYATHATTGAKGWRSLTLTGATDFPAAYTGAAGKFLKVNAGATAVEFAAVDIQAMQDAIADLTARVVALEGA